MARRVARNAGRGREGVQTQPISASQPPPVPSPWSRNYSPPLHPLAGPCCSLQPLSAPCARFTASCACSHVMSLQLLRRLDISLSRALPRIRFSPNALAKLAESQRVPDGDSSDCCDEV
ncbi:hypothetical protein EXIGLDRAFT_141585 [Exidia glandulosa HHB12029]|uniref:Uncharacterized protein n=1 Tax=Exidia glandulosa HHB12029 TaxID=1314781 RepID=A0A165FU29_EXIGL|nr:hypothetical protein EXIGLDRAFT_141585 [Exidia glandulosa HHB12029]